MNSAHPSEERGRPPEWIVTFADLMLLLLCFFILLLSFSELEPTRFQQVANLMRETFRPGSVALDAPEPAPVSVVAGLPLPGYTQTDSYRHIAPLVDRVRADSRFEQTLALDSIEMSVAAATLFDDGSARLNAEGRAFVGELIDVSGQSGAKIAMQLAVTSSAGPSWNLASDRARVLGYSFLDAQRAGASVGVISDAEIPEPRVLIEIVPVSDQP